jgi:hypothetical protein
MMTPEFDGTCGLAVNADAAETVSKQNAKSRQYLPMIVYACVLHP